jgi:hypothetical protein
MQRSANTDHAGAQDENVGLQFRHSALRKLNVTGALEAPKLKLAIAANPRKPMGFSGELRLRGGQTLATWLEHGPAMLRQ